MAITLEGDSLLFTVTTLTCLGFLLIGFDNGLMGGFVNSTAFTETFGIDTDTSAGTNLIALIVAIYEIGCFIGAITTSFIGENLGRRKSVLVGVIIMIIGKFIYSPFPLVSSVAHRIQHRGGPPGEFISHSADDCCTYRQWCWHGVYQLDRSRHAG